MEVPSTYDGRLVCWRSDGTPAGRAWATMLDLTLRIWDEFQARAQGVDLTAPQAKALLYAHASPMLTVGELAARLRYDPSSVTYLCDRFERRGLLERVPSPEDRRRRVVRLTAEGERLAGRLLTALQVPPPALQRLSAEQAVHLNDLLLDGLA